MHYEMQSTATEASFESKLLCLSFHIVTMRYTHTNLDSKKAAVTKLESFGDKFSDSVHQNAAVEVKVSPIAPVSAAVGYN